MLHEAAPCHLDGAVLADQALIAATVDPDHGPVRLLAAESAWEMTAQRPMLRRRTTSSGSALEVFDRLGLLLRRHRVCRQGQQEPECQ